ncbi:MAG: ferritin family protein [Nanobdellota archaeon]
MLLKAIFDSIEEREKKALEEYRELAKKVCDKDVKKMLLKVADDELQHKKFFSDFDVSKIKGVSSEDINYIGEDIKKKLGEKSEKLPAVECKEDVINTINVAIKAEEEARNSYNVLADRIPDEDIKKSLKNISEQEQYHITVLQKIKLEVMQKNWKDVFS